MRILLGVHQFFPRYYAGTERYVLNLARHFQRLGHSVKVLTCGDSDTEGFTHRNSRRMLVKEYSYQGVPVISLKHEKQLEAHAALFDFFDPDLYEEVKMILDNEAFDIYHCAHPLRIASSIQAAKDSGIKVVFMATDYFLMCPLGIMMRMDYTLCTGPDQGRNCLRYCFSKISPDQWEKRHAAAQEIIARCDRILSPSRFLIGLFDYAGVIPAGRFLLSPHGFDYSLKKDFIPKEPKEGITFGYIGTIQYHKGVHVLIEGFRRARHKNIKLQLWGGFYGDSDYHRSIETMASRDPRIELKGPYDYKHVASILQGIDAVVVPSIWYENAPLTILTSLAYRIPVIASDIGGMKEMLKNGRNGFPFKAGDPDALAGVIDLIADNPDRIHTFRREIVPPVRIEEEALHTELIYRELRQ